MLIRPGRRAPHRINTFNLASPNSISGCVLWLQADRGITLNGSTVSSWADQSSGGNTFTQGTAANQPTFSAQGGPNGLPALVFNGTTTWMKSAASVTASVQNWTQFVVVKVANTTQATTFIFSTGLANGWGYGIAATGLRAIDWVGTGSGTFGSNTTNWEMWSNWDIAGNNTTCRVNGVSTPSSPTISPTTSSGGSSVGAFNVGVTPSNWWAGNMYAVMVYNRTLAAGEIVAVENYIRSRTGIW